MALGSGPWVRQREREREGKARQGLVLGSGPWVRQREGKGKAGTNSIPPKPCKTQFIAAKL